MLNKSTQGEDVFLMQRTMVANDVEDAQAIFVEREAKNPEFVRGQLNGGWVLATHNEIPQSSVEKPISEKQVVNAIMGRMKKDDNALLWGIGKKLLNDVELKYITELCKE